MKKSIAITLSYILLLTLFIVHNAASQPLSAAKPKIVNIVNFIRLLEPRDPQKITEDVLFQTVVKQVEIMRQYKLRGTFLLQYDALMDKRYQNLLKSLPKDSFEIGAWWEIPQPLVERAGYAWRGRFPWDWHANVGFSVGYTQAERKKLADVYMKDFKDIFGYYPKSVGSWFIDAYTLGYMSEAYAIDASCNCKDQVGTDGYTMWGGYWNQAYYPSRLNAYMPAQKQHKQIPVPVFRMLGSDPIRQYDSRIGSSMGVETLEPVYKGAGGNAPWVHWYFREFVESEAMEYAYVQAGQENSFTWKEMEKGFEIQMPLLGKLNEQGKIKVETLGESGRWFKQQYKTTPATSVTVNKDIDDSDQKTVWFNSRYYRANFLWENNGLRIRDIHIFNEDLASDYYNGVTTTNKFDLYTLPFVDGYFWSTKEQRAGIQFKLKRNGKTENISGGDPEITNPVKGQLNITWPLQQKGQKLTITLHEQELLIKASGLGVKSWFLELNVATLKDLPFTRISANRVDARFKGMDYSVKVVKGTALKQQGQTVFSIRPDAANSIQLHFAQPTK